ncbi:hypothetical protein [Abyssisolibacter fermentans]|uniref:hypothetical protein n=1 Tax=Abyssisolibacter fermentans TaxID=1766203 RepID=UPI00083603B3|nr:hypothetical protein [Abyssisolibacter fermentans]
MKKFIIICMAVMLIFNFTGCGKKKYTEEDLKKEMKEYEEQAKKSFDGYEKVPDFNCIDVKGNEINQEIFSDYKLTMINIWSAY